MTTASLDAMASDEGRALGAGGWCAGDRLRPARRRGTEPRSSPRHCKDPDIVGIFTANLFSAEGAATGVRQANKQDHVKIVGFDAGPDQVKALRGGTVQALVAQQPGRIGQVGVDQAVKALKGEPT